MGVKFKAATCPKDNAFALEMEKGNFKCRKCGHVFKPAGKNKFHAERSEVAGMVFESRAEKRYILTHLVLRQKAGQVKDIRVKPRYEIDTGIFYKPEVTFYDITLKTDVSVDVKGSATMGGRFPTVKKIWRNHMNHPLHIVEYDSKTGNFLTTMKILPRGKELNP